MRGTGAGQPVGAMKPGKTGRSEGVASSGSDSGSTASGGEEPRGRAKPFCISKQVVLEAYKRVKANRGTAGVDFESVEDFEKDLKGNLYKIWNRMSSGTYFPPPVKTVAIPRKNGGERKLGIPTVADRVAQTVVKMYLEPLVEPYFHPDSYGYRPKKSALEAVGVTKERCWRFDWVIDLDIRGFFDSLDHALVMRAVRRYTSSRWILLYVERWLKAPAQLEDGTLVAREKGTPQGGVVSPLLANIFLHLAFDEWMQKTHPGVPFERYADDGVVHCKTEEHAQVVKRSIEERLRSCKLELHPEKTRIVYCKDKRRRGSYPNVTFDFLGYTFRPRRSRSREGEIFLGFNPAISRAAASRMHREMRRWRVPIRSDLSLEDLASMANPALRGWIRYFGRYRKSALNPILYHLNLALIRWARGKYKKLRGLHRAYNWLGRVARQDPKMFAHWHLLGLLPQAG